MLWRCSQVLYLFFAALSLQFSDGSTIDGEPFLQENGIKCAEFSEDCTKSGQKDCGKVQLCTGDFPNCFAAWRNTSNGLELVQQGCWHQMQSCQSSECVQERKQRSVDFCCCNKEMCNINITALDIPPPQPVLTPDPTDSPIIVKPAKDSQVMYTLLYSIVPIIVLVIITVTVFVMWRCYMRENRYMQHQQLSTGDPEIDSPPSPHPLRPIQLVELRAHGRFGEVWKANMIAQWVAVKIMPLKERASWLTEQDIYKLPHMKHENILNFIGAEKREENLWLISEFHENGSLCDYLKGNTITWSELCKIAETMTKGLAYLHDEIPKMRGMEGKPAVAHRDFKSKNVLLKDDLSASIADLGLAIKFEPGKSPGETHGLVGTRRYMAPEVLEGAISFNRDAFLRIDMYACGLVLWELVTRCSAIDGPIDDYQLPYEEEIGSHPTLEDLQELVVMKKVRPTIKEHWLRHSGIDALYPTIDECWDQDAEARVSADCVHERLIQLGRTLNVSSNPIVQQGNMTETRYQSTPTIST